MKRTRNRLTTRRGWSCMSYQLLVYAIGEALTLTKDSCAARAIADVTHTAAAVGLLGAATLTPTLARNRRHRRECMRRSAVCTCPASCIGTTASSRSPGTDHSAHRAGHNAPIGVAASIGPDVVGGEPARGSTEEVLRPLLPQPPPDGI